MDGWKQVGEQGEHPKRTNVSHVYYPSYSLRQPAVVIFLLTLASILGRYSRTKLETYGKLFGWLIGWLVAFFLPMSFVWPFGASRCDAIFALHVLCITE